MANEITINIESSLAAMAFVVADQQETIKILRNRVSELMSDYNKLVNKYNECDRIREEWFKKFEMCSTEKEELYIKFGTIENENDELKQELDGVKSDLAKEKELRQTQRQSHLLFLNAHSAKPEHGKLYLCIVDSNPGSILNANNFELLKYNDKAKYWDEHYADVDNGDHDDGVCDYGDYRVKYFAEIDPLTFAIIDNTVRYDK